MAIKDTGKYIYDSKSSLLSTFYSWVVFYVDFCRPLCAFASYFFIFTTYIVQKNTLTIRVGSSGGGSMPPKQQLFLQQKIVLRSCLLEKAIKGIRYYTENQLWILPSRTYIQMFCNLITHLSSAFCMFVVCRGVILKVFD